MYKHILLPVDGSEFGMGAVEHAIKLAQALDARITAITVTAPYETIAVGEVAAYLSEDDYRRLASSNADALLGRVRSTIEAAGVPVSTQHVQNAHPWEAIVAAGERLKADLILMASHGRRGLAGLLIGSETKKVLTHTTIPVLVWRA